MAKGKRRSHKLPQNHGWKARRGNKIFVADRGKAQFEYPADWIVSPGEGGSIRFFDKEEADADIRLEVSVIYVPPIDWSGLPLDGLLQDVALSGSERAYTGQGPFRNVRRPSLEAAWLEVDFIDPEEDRLAHSRICMARGPGIYSFITLDFWPEDAGRAHKVWNGVIDTLKLDERRNLSLDGRAQPPPPKFSMN